MADENVVRLPLPDGEAKAAAPWLEVNGAGEVAARTELFRETTYNTEKKNSDFLAMGVAGAPEYIARGHAADRTSLQMAASKLGNITGTYFVADEQPATTVTVTGAIESYAGYEYAVGDIHIQPLEKDEGDEYNIAALARVTEAGRSISMGIVRSEVLGYDEVNKWRFVKGVWGEPGELYTVKTPMDAIITTNAIRRSKPDTLEVYDEGGVLRVSEDAVKGLGGGSIAQSLYFEEVRIVDGAACSTSSGAAGELWIKGAVRGISSIACEIRVNGIKYDESNDFTHCCGPWYKDVDASNSIWEQFEIKIDTAKKPSMLNLQISDGNGINYTRSMPLFGLYPEQIAALS